MNQTRPNFFAGLAGAAICLLAGAVTAQTVDSVLQESQQNTQQAVQSQQRVDQVANQTEEVVLQYRQVLKEIENLRVYNAQLQLQIDDQNRQLEDLAQSITEATSMEVNLVPLQLQMVDALEQLVEVDLPFSLRERRTRVDRLSANLDRSDLSTAEKFRQILEAYRIETNYGKNIDNYSDTIEVNGVELEVDILRVGRIALMYQTKDQAITGAWNPSSQRWEQLPARPYQNAVATGLRIARQQAAIDIMTLPITAPQG